MDHTDVGLRAVVKALTDVVAPAVNPADPLASEQLRLAVDYIEFVRSRLDFFYDRERFDLQHHLAMARSLHEIAGPLSLEGAPALQDAIDAGARAIGEAGTSIRALKAATAGLAAAMAPIIRGAADLDEPARRKIERCVLEATEARIAFERSWYLPLGFDPAPNEVQSLQDLASKT